MSASPLVLPGGFSFLVLVDRSGAGSALPAFSAVKKYSPSPRETEGLPIIGSTGFSGKSGQCQKLNQFSQAGQVFFLDLGYLEAAGASVGWLSGLGPHAFRFKPNVVHVEKSSTRDHQALDLSDPGFNADDTQASFRNVAQQPFPVRLFAFIDWDRDGEQVPCTCPNVINNNSVLSETSLTVNLRHRHDPTVYQLLESTLKTLRRKAVFFHQFRVSHAGTDVSDDVSRLDDLPG